MIIATETLNKNDNSIFKETYIYPISSSTL